MKQKLLSILTLLVLCVTGAWADNVSVGRSVAFNNTATDFSMTNVSNTTVTKSDGTGNTKSSNDTQSVCYHGSSVSMKGNLCYVNKIGSTSVNHSSNFNDNLYCGFNLTIADGYKLTVSNVTISLASSANVFYNVKIIDLDNENAVLYGGEASNIAVTNYNSNSYANQDHTFTPSSTLVLTGHVQVRLYWNQNSTSKYICPLDMKVNGNIEVAAPAAPHTVTFTVGSHGTCATTELTEASAGAGVELPSVTANTGYTFNGWYTAATGGTKEGDAGDTYKPADDIELFAQYSAKTYTVKLDDNGGTSDGTATATYDSNTLTSITAPEKEGNSVVGYYKEEGCTTLVADAEGNLQANIDGYGAGGIWTADEAKTLYAKWEAATYTLTNAVNEDGWGTVAPASVEGIAYNTATSSSTNTYTVGETVVTATPASSTAEYTYAFDSWSNLPANVTADATVTANFTRTPVNYTLSWNANGGDDLTGEYTSGTVAYGSAITTPTTPTYTGYIFLGWSESADGAAVTVAETMPARDVTYYAQWGYSLTWDLDLMATNAVTTSTPTSSTDKLSSMTNISQGTELSNPKAGTSGTNTCSITGFNGTDADDNSLSMSFTVADGYQFIPTSVVLKTTAVSEGKTIYVKIGDNVQSWSQGKSASPTPEAHTYSFVSPEVCMGKVPVKIYASSSTNGIRLGTPIIVYGKIEAIPSSVSATIPSSGWGTYCSKYNLDFSDASTEVLAYAVSAFDAESLTVTYEKQTGVVPAGTGLLLYGETGSKTIATTGEKGTAPAVNKLDGFLSATPYSADGDVRYLGMSGGSWLEMTAGTIPAGKAALKITSAEMSTVQDKVAGGAKFTIIYDDGETTGIESIHNSWLSQAAKPSAQFTIHTDAPMYNLSGQRVIESYKGIVIVNGRKVIRK